MKQKQAKFIGFDISTLQMSLGVRSADGEEDFASAPMEGARKWLGQPAFNISRIPGMMMSTLLELHSRGWRFDKPGAMSFSMRQHDMVLLGPALIPIVPALSWQCTVASVEVQKLREKGVEKLVGKVEERFILPKLMWVLRQNPQLAAHISKVVTTGDFVSYMLTGRLHLCTSDAVSNGLLFQKSKRLAISVINNAGLRADWFPQVIQSGMPMGKVHSVTFGADRWTGVRGLLDGWTVVSGLGDNHATGVGCGLTDTSTMVISAGSSGTIVRACERDASLAGKAGCFEYYNRRLLLMTLAECAVWYERFYRTFAEGVPLPELDRWALAVDSSRFIKISQGFAGGAEVYPQNWNSVPSKAQVASTQYSIAIELLKLAKVLSEEVTSPCQGIRRVILAGGLSRSPLIQQIISAGIANILPKAKVFVNNSPSPLAPKSAAMGAVINAMIGTIKNSPAENSPAKIVESMSSLKKVGRPPFAFEDKVASQLS